MVNKDGTPLARDRRQITLSGTEETTRGTKTIDERILVRDDGLALFQYKPDPEGTFIKLTVSMRIVIHVCLKYHLQKIAL